MEVDPLSTPAAREGGRIRWTLIVLGVWLLATGLFALLAAGVVTPRRAQDEFLFWSLAHSLADGVGLQWRGGAVSLTSSLYPAFASTAARATAAVATQFELLKVLNAAAMSAVVFPTYLLASKLVERRWALLAALFAIAIPAMNYVAMIETESLAYPLCVAALAALVVLTARPGLRPTLLFFGLAVLAALTRVQFVILLPIALLAPLVMAILLERGTRGAYLRAQKWLWAGLGAGFALGVVYIALRGRSALGIYVGLIDRTNFVPGDLVYWLRAYASDIYLMSAFVPAVATFALFSQRARRERLVIALLAVALVATIVFVLQVTALSVTNYEHWRERHVLYERYLFYLAPLYFVGLVAALGRVSLRAASISFAVGACVVALTPVGSITVPYTLDAFGQAYLGFLIDAHPVIEARVVLFLVLLVLLAGAAFVASTVADARSTLARWGRALAITLPLFALVLTQAKAWSYQQLYASDSRDLLPVTIDWVARTSDQRVAQMIVAETDRTIFHQTEFWNPNVDRIYISQLAPVDSPPTSPPYCTLSWTPTGLVLPTVEPGCAMPPRAWLVQSPQFSLHLRDEGQRVRPAGRVPMELVFSNGPTRFFALVSGRNSLTGRVADQLVVRSFLDRPGALRITFAGRRSPVETAVAAGDRLRRFRLDGATVTRLDLREGDGPWRSIL
jgi:hypothetical protein